jgi:NDP-sugar pyrophosphorylase family protein
MILAAGLGSRLRPLTDRTPKPLLEVGGVTILERVARRLIAAGADRLIVNASHLAEQVEAFLKAKDGFGAEWHLSLEREPPLETGGAILHARGFFRADAPFFLHNGDILTDLPLGDLYAAQLRDHPLATVAVMRRDTTRTLLFDERGLLGRTDRTRDLDLRVRPAEGEVQELGFAGVHVISPRIFELLTERGAFSILGPYLRLAGEGEVIRPFRVDGCRWTDIGRPEQLRAAREAAEEEPAAADGGGAAR